MTTYQSIDILARKVAAQATDVPSIYGRVDFSITPERFAAERSDQSELASEFAGRRAELLVDEERVAIIKAYTMRGDPVADAYAALIRISAAGRDARTGLRSRRRERPRCSG
jgi:hypothetical protein